MNLFAFLLPLIVGSWLVGLIGDRLVSRFHADSTPERRRLARIVRDCAVNGYFWTGVAAALLQVLIAGKVGKEAALFAGFGMLGGLATGLVIERLRLWRAE